MGAPPRYGHGRWWGHQASRLAVASPLIQLFFWDARRWFASFPHAQAAAGGKQRAAGGRDRGELGQADPRHVDVDRLYLAAPEVGLVPEASAAPVSQELLPPLPVRQGAGPALEGVEVTPVLTHSRVGREQREQHGLVQQQTVGLRFDRLADLRAERDEGRQALRLVDPHPQV